MKLFATLILTAAAATSLLAASMPRCDISGVSQKGNVKLTPGTIEGGLQVGRQNCRKKPVPAASSLPPGRWSDRNGRSANSFSLRKNPVL